MHPTLQRRPPVHDTYTTRPRDSRRQAEVLRDLDDNDVGWAIIMSMGRLRDTHPRVPEHIDRTCERVDVDWLPSPHRIYRRH